jgi:hypothetical protein
MTDLSALIRSIGENFVSLANELDKQQKEAIVEIDTIRNEVYKNKNLLKNIANIINEEL